LIKDQKSLLKAALVFLPQDGCLSQVGFLQAEILLHAQYNEQ